MSISKKTLSIAGAIMLLSSVVGLSFGVNEYFAKDAELSLLAMRLDQKILMDRYHSIQQRIWMLEDRCRKTDCSTETKAEIRHLELELEEIKMQLDRLGS